VLAILLILLVDLKDLSFQTAPAYGRTDWYEGVFCLIKKIKSILAGICTNHLLYTLNFFICTVTTQIAKVSTTVPLNGAKGQ